MRLPHFQKDLFATKSNSPFYGAIAAMSFKFSDIFFFINLLGNVIATIAAFARVVPRVAPTLPKKGLSLRPAEKIDGIGKKVQHSPSAMQYKFNGSALVLQ